MLFRSVNIDPFYGNSKNRIILRYAEVLLMKAEALIELNRYNEALPLINALRERAANSTSMLIDIQRQPVSNYKVGLYASFASKAEATKALRFERRLELAMEGARFFDLVRWGVADQVLNQYFQKEKDLRDYYSVARFTKNRDEY